MQNLFINLLLIRQTKFLYLSFFCFAIAVGINFVTFPSILKLHNLSAFQIGLAFTLEILGVSLMSFFLSKITNKYGIYKTLRANTIIYCSVILLIYFYYSYYLWLLLVFILGCCWLIFAITRISWLNIFFNNEERGVGIGIFSATISLGVAIGPIIVNFSGAENYLSFVISAFFVLCAFLALIPIKNITINQVNSSKIPIKQFYKKNPNCFMTRFFLDFTTYIIVSLTVVFGRSIGLSNEKAGLLITAYLASGFFDIIVGFILKKTTPKKLINIGFIGCLYSFLLVILYHHSFKFLLLMFFIFGLFIACIYVSVFKMVNEDYENEQLISGNTTFQFIGTIGAFCGSLLGGLMIDIFGSQGFGILICFGALFYLTFLVIYEKTN